MAIPPKWKIRRELWRIREQMRALVAPVYEGPRQAFHDRLRANAMPVHAGDLPVGSKVALVVLFQPKGIAASTLFSFEHLISKGWTPIAVSNSKLSRSDLGALALRTARVIERPNVGYDFGAYRDGILALQRLSIAPERLILMNDSTWFPLSEDDTSLERMEALDADLTGHILKIEDENNRRRDHIESHLLMIGPGLLHAEDFHRFWRGYVMSNYRDTTIERGEKAFSQLAINGPYRAQALLDRESMVELLTRLNDESLREVLENIVHHRRSHYDKLARMIASAKSRDGTWRKDFLEWTHNELSHSLQHLVSSTFIHPAITHGGMGFIKKSNEMRFHLARKKLIEMDDRGTILPLNPVVRQEIVAAIENWTVPFDWRRRPEDQARDQGEQLGP